MEDNLFLQQLTDKWLPAYLQRCRWYGGKARKIDDLMLRHVIPMDTSAGTCFLLVLSLVYHDGKTEQYFLPLMPAPDDHPEAKALIGKLQSGGKTTAIIDAIYHPAFREALYRHFIEDSRLVIDADTTLAFERSKTLAETVADAQETSVLNADQSNSALIIDNKYFLKLYRKVDYEINPDLEITRFLTEETSFSHLPAFAGGICLYTDNHPVINLGMMQQMVANKGDAWTLTLRLMERTFERIVQRGITQEPVPNMPKDLYYSYEQLPPLMQACVAPETAHYLFLLGKRSAEMHIGLASGTTPAFQPVPFDDAYRLSFFDHLEQLLNKRIKLVKSTFEDLSPTLQQQISYLIDHRDTILQCFRQFKTLETTALRTRIHGDFHLGQILSTGDDFIILDYEGEPESTLSARKIKHSPLKDIAGMIRSFHYALFSTILFNERFRSISPSVSDDWREAIFRSITNLYLHGYFSTAAGSAYLPVKHENTQLLLDLHTLEKAVYELGYELNGRPDWVIIPLQGIRYIVNGLEQTPKTN